MHKEQIKDGWRRSNKNNAAGQIVNSHSHQHAIRMRLLNLESLRRRGADHSTDVLQHLESTVSAVTAPVVYRRILKGRRDDVSNVLDLSKVSGVSLESICGELIRYSRHSLRSERRLPEDHPILRRLPVELLTQLEIPVLASKKGTFTTSTVCDAQAPYISGNRGIAMIGFGSRLALKRCMAR